MLIFEVPRFGNVQIIELNAHSKFAAAFFGFINHFFRKT